MHRAVRGETQLKEVKDKLSEAIVLCDQLLSGECTHDDRQELTTMGDANRTFLCFDCKEEWKEEPSYDEELL